MVPPDDTIRALLDPIPAAFDDRPGLRPAAVLAPLWRRDGAECLLLTKRPAAMKSHPGQVAFPGGRRDGDETPLACALRESREEVGIDPAAVDVLGAIPARISSAGFLVYVVVGRVPDAFAPRPDAREVEHVFAPRVEDLATHASWRFEMPAGSKRLMPHYDLPHGVLWGLTARFTWDLLERFGHAPLATPSR